MPRIASERNEPNVVAGGDGRGRNFFPWRIVSPKRERQRGEKWPLAAMSIVSAR